MGKLNIYLAGKISKNDWRSGILQNAGLAVYGKETLEKDWPVLDNVIFGHNYTGPYFYGDDHGCFHGEDSHGAGAGRDYVCGIDNSANTRDKVFLRCSDALRKSNVMFAWLNDLSAYGTLVEIGMFYQLGLSAGTRELWIASDTEKFDFWFAYSCATRSILSESPSVALKKLISSSGRFGLDYQSYILSDAWREKANAAKLRAGNRCQICNKSSDRVTLDAHHRTYERLGDENPEDITVLCRNCHSLFHENMNGGKKKLSGRAKLIATI